MLPQVVRSWMGAGAAPDPLLVNALLLNIALVIFGWRRYAELTGEVAERRKAEELARQLAETDPLTGCLNRRSIGLPPTRCSRRSHADGRAAAFVMVDLDNFKQVNDLNGHLAGDALLEATATRIAALLPARRAARAAGRRRIRLRGAVRSAHARSHRPVRHALIDRVAEPLDARRADDRGDRVGRHRAANWRRMARNQPTSVDAQALIHRADIAMYHAKKQGRNRYFWFEPNDGERAALPQRARDRHPPAASRAANSCPYYEQQIDLETGELTGFEMLARWQSPELGLVSPEVFIPIAEEIGVIAELSECADRPGAARMRASGTRG